MLEALDITEEEAAGLTRIAALDLDMAEHFAAMAKAAEDPEEKNRYARSYHRAARSYRQTILLKTRLKREIAMAVSAAEAALSAARPRAERIAQRKDEVRRGVERLVWEGLGLDLDEEIRERIVAAVNRRLAEIAASPGFLHESVRDLVNQVVAILDRDLEAFFVDDADPPPAEPDNPDAWRGSG